MFEVKLGPKHFLVIAAKFLEWFLCSSLADSHICVSRALKSWLQSNFNVKATVFHDKPASMFKAYSINDAHSLLRKLTFVDSLIFKGTQNFILFCNSIEGVNFII